MHAFGQSFGWMAWTWQTELFFAVIAACLAGLTVLAVKRPESPRLGILGFATTRGDRFFVSMILAAFIFLLYIRIGGEQFLFPAAAALAIAALMFRFA